MAKRKTKKEIKALDLQELLETVVQHRNLMHAAVDEHPTKGHRRNLELTRILCLLNGKSLWERADVEIIRLRWNHLLDNHIVRLRESYDNLYETAKVCKDGESAKFKRALVESEAATAAFRDRLKVLVKNCVKLNSVKAKRATIKTNRKPTASLIIDKKAFRVSVDGRKFFKISEPQTLFLLAIKNARGKWINGQQN